MNSDVIMYQFQRQRFFFNDLKATVPSYHCKDRQTELLNLK